MGPVLSVHELHHAYGATCALAGVDLTVAAGETVALLGPNGAGKTTLIDVATGLWRRQRGRVEVAGGDPRDAATRRRIGVVQQSTGFPRTLTVREVVGGAAVRAGRRRDAVGPVLAETGIAHLGGRRVPQLSGGQQQRVALAMALVADPLLLLLDEPTNGLDLEGRRGFWDTVRRHRDRGVAVLLTTHVVSEAAAIADRVVVLGAGRVIAAGTPQELARRLPGVTITARTRLAPARLHRLDGVVDVVRDGTLTRLFVVRPEAATRALLAADPDLTDLRVEGATLEQAVAALTLPHDPVHRLPATKEPA